MYNSRGKDTRYMYGNVLEIYASHLKCMLKKSFLDNPVKDSSEGDSRTILTTNIESEVFEMQKALTTVEEK